MKTDSDTRRAGRPLLRSWSADDEADRTIEVVLELAGQQFRGRSNPQDSAAKATALATLDALRDIAGAGVELELEEIAVTDVGNGAPAIVNTLIWVRRGTREEMHVGAAVDRGDAREAAARATLDALNRLIVGFRTGAR